MNTVKRYITLAILLGLSSAALAQSYSETWEQSNSAPAGRPVISSEYTLGWQDTQKETNLTKPATPAVEAPVAVNLAALPSLISASTGVALHSSSAEVASATVPGLSSRLRGPSPVSVPTHDITLHAERYYDNYADNYRYVNKVEVVTYRGGYPRTDVYENYAQYTTYDVYINDLKAGDRYEVRVTWDDGNYRILSRSIDRYPEHNVRVSSPG